MSRSKVRHIHDLVSSIDRDKNYNFCITMAVSFSSNQEAIAVVEGYFADLMKNQYRDEIMALEHRWNKCTSLRGDYVEK